MRRGRLAGKGRQPVLQQRKVGRHLLADEIGAGRQHLPKLDEGGPERGQRAGQPFARSSRLPAIALPAPRQHRHNRRDAGAFQDVADGLERAVPIEGARDRDQPGDVAERAQHWGLRRRRS